MAKSKPFSKLEWKKIRDLLRKDPEKFGLPRREYGSVLFGSFNIRKFGNPENRDKETWEFETQAIKQEQKEFIARFEHRVSDHMPIWVRIPLFEAPIIGRPPR